MSEIWNPAANGTVSSGDEDIIAIARKSIVARRPIQQGELLTEENLATKRPGNGISPMCYPKVLGTRAVKDFMEDELIVLEKGSGPGMPVH